MGGRFDSSLTRVQPAFDQLADKEAPWLEKVCRLGSRSALTQLPTVPNSWAWTPPPVYEYSCLAPLDYLEYLLINAPDSTVIANERLATGNDEVSKKRQELFQGDQATLDEGLVRLRGPDGRRSKRGSWQVYEGTTKVDCALFADGVTVFIEGKRTEPHLTDATQWHRHRNQVARNLDCLRVDPNRADNWFVLLVVEEGTSASLEAHHLDDDRETFLRSLPHLAASEVDEVRSHYLGFTTWQDIQDGFDLQPYPDVSEHTQHRRSKMCPKCGTTGLPIFYGLPSHHPYKVAAERGLIVLGGDVIHEDPPTWACPSCGASWDGPNTATRIREIARLVSAEKSTLDQG